MSQSADLHEVSYRGNPTDLNANGGCNVHIYHYRTGASVPLESVGRHSPDGFSWGYEGSGPAELALAIITDVIHNRVGPDNTREPLTDEQKDLIVEQAYQSFKAQIIAGHPRDSSFEISAAFVRGWLSRSAP